VLFDKIEKRNTENEFDWTAWVKGEDVEISDSLKDITYITALNIVSNTVASLPIILKQETEKGEIEAKDNYLWNILKYRPNPNMSMSDCIKSLTMQYKHNGMAGLYVDRNGDIGRIKGLYPCKITGITVDDVGLIESNKENKVMVDFDCAGVQGSCLDKYMIIIKDNSFDGIHGKPTKNYIKNTTGANIKAQEYQQDLFSNGMTNKAVVQYTTDIKDEQDIKDTQDKFNRLYSNKGRIFTVPMGFQVTPLNLDLASSQFSELKIIGKKDVASALGVPYDLLEKGYLDLEGNRGYLANTINPILMQLQQEMDWKILGENNIKKGFKIRFNTNIMLKTNPKEQQEILCDYLKSGVYTTNDVRDILGLERVEGGDTILYPSGQVTLENLINGNASWQKDKTTAIGGDKDE
jgi:HK97 family phage portal protein